MLLGNYFHKGDGRTVHFVPDDFGSRNTVVFGVGFYNGSAWLTTVYVEEERSGHGWSGETIDRAAEYLLANEMFGVITPYGSESPCEKTPEDDNGCFCEMCDERSIPTDSGYVVVEHVWEADPSFLSEIEPLND